MIVKPTTCCYNKSVNENGLKIKLNKRIKHYRTVLKLRAIDSFGNFVYKLLNLNLAVAYVDNAQIVCYICNMVLEIKLGGALWNRMRICL